MRRNFMKSLVMSAAAFAGLAGTAGSNPVLNSKATVPVRQEAVTPDKKKPGKQRIAVNPLTGGLDLPPIFPANVGLSPKEYGMRYGNGGSKRSNRLRYGHNAKLKRRMAS